MDKNFTKAKPQNIIDKIWDKHVVVQNPGHPAVFAIDLQLTHEVTSPQGFSRLKNQKLKVKFPHKHIATLDHSIPTRENREEIYDETAKKQVETLRRNTDEFGIKRFDFGSGHQGIVHVIGPELGLTQPGMTIVCGDSHTSTHGAFGALAFGVGSTEVGLVMATGCILQTKPKTFKVEFKGKFQDGVYSKDAILYLISKIGVGGANGHVIEFCGEAVENMTMAERMTMCNMSIECGARAGLVSPDHKTIEWILGLEEGGLNPKNRSGDALITMEMEDLAVAESLQLHDGEKTKNNLNSQIQAYQKQGYVVVLDAIISNQKGQILVQKRSAKRKIYPNCWDLVGGHLEEGESAFDGLAREIKEETGFELKEITKIIHTEKSESEIAGKKCVIFAVKVEVKGSLDNPELEKGKASEWKWIDSDNLEILKEKRKKGETYIYDVVKKAFEDSQIKTNSSYQNRSGDALIDMENLKSLYQKAKQRGSLKKYTPKFEDWKKAIKHWMSFKSDAKSQYDKEISIDVSKLKPMITWGTNPSQGMQIDENIPDFEKDFWDKKIGKFADKLSDIIEEAIQKPQEISLGKLSNGLTKKLKLETNPEIILVSGSRSFGWSHNTKHHKDISILDYAKILLLTVFNNNALVFKSKKDEKKFLVIYAESQDFENLTLCKYYLDKNNLKLIPVWKAHKNYITAHIKEENIEEYLNTKKLPSKEAVNSLIPAFSGLPATFSGVWKEVNSNLSSLSEKSQEQKKALEYTQLKSGQKLLGQKIDWVFLGSCTNSRINDLRVSAEIFYPDYQACNLGNKEINFITTNKQEVKIRKSTSEDAADIAKVVEQGWIKTYTNPDLGITKEKIQKQVKVTKEVIQKFVKKIQDPNKIYFSAVTDGQTVGFAGADDKNVDNPEIFIYIRPEFQGQKIGTKLFDKLLFELRNKEKILLETVNYNHKAIEFYKKIGFNKTYEKQATYGKIELPIYGMEINRSNLDKFLFKKQNWQANFDPQKVQKVAKNVTMYVVSGSEETKKQAENEGLDKIFKAAGAEWRNPGCSMCLGMNDDKVPAGKRCLSTSNRNFRHRQGSNSITHLCSPATATKGAIAGKVEF